MGARKRHTAEKRKEKKQITYTARLYNNPTSPQKARIVADLIRGVNVNKALVILEHTKREPAVKLHKLLKSAIANWQSKNEGTRIEDANLYIKEISIDGGRVLKRIKTAPQGRAARIKKRSNHIILTIDNRELAENNNEEIVATEEVPEVTEVTEEVTTAEQTEAKPKKVSKKSKIKE